MFKMSSNNNVKIKDIAKTIDDILQSRLIRGTQDIYLQSKLNIDDFDQLLRALKFVETKDITRQYISVKNKSVYFVTKNNHIVCADRHQVYDSMLPMFNLEDMFATRWLIEELHGPLESWL